MPNEDKKILKYNHGEKSLKVTFMIYADLECLLEKTNTCQNNPKKSYTEKKAKHIPSGYSWFTCCSFDVSENKFVKKLCKDFRDQAIKIINYEKKRNDTAN